MSFHSIHENLQQTLHGCQPSNTLFLVCPSHKFSAVVGTLLNSVRHFFWNNLFLLVSNYMFFCLKEGVNIFTMIAAYFEFQVIKHIFQLDLSPFYNYSFPPELHGGMRGTRMWVRCRMWRSVNITWGSKYVVSSLNQLKPWCVAKWKFLEQMSFNYPSKLKWNTCSQET
jgi:hypothetical protein